MKQIFEGEVFEILPTSNGIIFSYCHDIIDDQIVVAFKMLSFETGRFTDVAKNIYLLTKFGTNYNNVIKHSENYVKVKSIVLPGGKVFLTEPDGSAMLIENDATPLWTGSFSYRGFAPSDIILCGDALWGSYPECNAILKYNLTTLKEELRIGGKASPELKPSCLFSGDDRNLLFYNKQNKNVSRLDTISLELYDYEIFTEEVFQYIEAGKNKFAILESGLFII